MSSAAPAGLPGTTHENEETPMRRVTYSMGMTLDGYVEDADGGFDWGGPDEEVFAFHLDELRQIGVHLLGRRLHETMLYWEDAEETQPLDDAEREWARMWKAVPKVVFSRSLTTVEGTNTRLADGSLVEEIERLRAEPGPGDIAIGGAELAAEAAAADLIDEYRPVVYPVLVGGGRPYFPQHARQVRLELVETRAFRSQVVHYRYRVAREGVV